MYEQWQHVLAQAPLFQNIPVKEVIELLECLWPRLEMYRKDEFAFLTGDPVEAMGLVLSGRLAVIKENALGQQLMLTVLEPGDMLGEVVVFAGVERFPSSVRTLEESVVVYLSMEQVLGMCAKGCLSHRMLMENMLKILAQKALLLNRKVEYLSIKTIRGKICALLFEHSRKAGRLAFVLPMSRSEMANFLNIPRPSISRELGLLRDEGVLQFDRAHFQILDLGKLKQYLS
jgi:CRP-like cAMP-binding protein